MKFDLKKRFIIYLLILASCSYLPEDPEAYNNLNYSENSEYISILPPSGNSSTGFMFIPGGLVDPHAYIAPLSYLVEQGFTVIIPKMAANLAIIESGKGLKIKQDFEGIDNWYLGGHSLGGISAQILVSKNPEAFKGLVFLGVYPSESYSLSQWNKNILSIFAENDLLADTLKIENGKIHLPQSTELNSPDDFLSLPPQSPFTFYYQIKGGNHSQFGDYDQQKGDGKATISPETQHMTVSNLIHKFIVWNEQI